MIEGLDRLTASLAKSANPDSAYDMELLGALGQASTDAHEELSDEIKTKAKHTADTLKAQDKLISAIAIYANRALSALRVSQVPALSEAARPLVEDAFSQASALKGHIGQLLAAVEAIEGHHKSTGEKAFAFAANVFTEGGYGMVERAVHVARPVAAVPCVSAYNYGGWRSCGGIWRRMTNVNVAVSHGNGLTAVGVGVAH